VAVNASPGAGRVLIASGDALVAEPSWTRYDNLSGCRCPGFDWQRGRQSEFDVTNTGTARVQFHDRNGTFDGATGIVGNQIMLQLYDPVLGTWNPCFRGHIDDVQVVPNPATVAGMNDVTVHCVDLFDYLGSVKFVVGAMGDPLPGKRVGVVFYEDGPVDTRITDLLDDAGLDPDMYVVFSGNIDVIEGQYDPDDNILRAVREASDAEFPSGVANAYCDRWGRVVWHGRFAKFSPDSVSGDAGPDAWDYQEWQAATMEDVTTGRAQIRVFGYDQPRTRIVNSYLAYPVKTPLHRQFPQSQVQALVRTDPSSIGLYGYRGREAPGLIIKEHKTNGNTGADECGLFGDYYIDNYNTPQVNIETCVFRSIHPSDARAAATWALMTRADIADSILFYVDEAGFNGDQYFIEGIQGSCQFLSDPVLGDNITITPNLSPAAYYTLNPF